MQGHFRHLRVRASIAVALCLSGLLCASTPALAQRRSPAPKPAVPAATAAPLPARATARTLLERGRALYDDQLYEESVQTLSAALLRPDRSEEDKRLVYQYLAYDYIVLGRKDEAEAAARALFVLEPEFTLPASESPRLREFFGTAKTRWEADGKPGLIEKTTPPAAVLLRHAAPAQVEEKKSFDVRGGITDPDQRVTSVRLFVRAGTKGRFESRPAATTVNSFSAIVPAALVKSPIVEYYFQAFDRTGLPVASRGDVGLPLRVAVKERGGSGWIAPVAIGGGVVGAAAIVGILALAGVFEASKPPPTGPGPTPTSTVTVVVRE